jgi:4-amino-4-deoxy-L-arabinose transferase-like glycosyltransferase
VQDFFNLLENRRFPLIFFIGLAVLLLVHNDHISLWEQDEAAYAGFARRMLHSGDWLIPDYFWSMIHRKTPLHFWNITLAYKLFGEHNFALRFSSALSIWLLYFGIYRIGRSFLGELEIRTGLIILSTSLLVNSLGKIAVTDGTLLLFTTLAGLYLIRHISGGGGLLNTLMFWMSVSLAALVKGPPVIIFVGFFSFLLLIFHKERMRLFQLHPWFFLPLAMLPLFLWGRAAWERDNGVFINWLLDWYVFRRFSGSMFGQTAPPGAYFLLISVAFLPWLFVQPMMWKESVREAYRKNEQFLLLLLWFIAAWLPFEFSPSKLPAYTAAAHVPFALMIGRFIARKQNRNFSSGWLFRLQLVLLCLISLALPAAGFYLNLSWFFKISCLIPALILVYAMSRMLLTAEVNYGRLGILNIGFSLFLWLVVYGQIDPVKNAPERVGVYLAGRYNQVVVGNNEGHPPGLFVYAERSVGKAYLMTNADTLRQMASSMTNTGFILSAPQWELTRSVSGFKLDTIISGQLTDRKGMASYYIASRR